MPLTIHPDTPPLRIDDAGAVRVGKTRVLFVLVVRAFQDGAQGVFDECTRRILRDYDLRNRRPVQLLGVVPADVAKRK